MEVPAQILPGWSCEVIVHEVRKLLIKKGILCCSSAVLFNIQVLIWSFCGIAAEALQDEWQC